MYNADYQRLLFIRLLPEGVQIEEVTDVASFFLFIVSLLAEGFQNMEHS